MENKKKTDYRLIVGSLIILAIIGYYSYRTQEYARTHGVYTISTITKKRPARGGWKADVVLWFRNQKYEYDPVIGWDVFSFREKKSKRFFTKILEDEPEKGFWAVYVLEVPDSIQSAPPEGWSEAWMKAHFPEVVADVYDTR